MRWAAAPALFLAGWLTLAGAALFAIDGLGDALAADSATEIVQLAPAGTGEGVAASAPCDAR